MYANKIGNIITFKIKTVNYLGFLTPETMKLLGRTKSKINNKEKVKNVAHLEISEIVLVHC